MSGTWYPGNDRFAFVANHIAKNGPDTFSGVYTNPTAGATANVSGIATNGDWLINLIYTDARHRGHEKNLVGTGVRGKNNLITIKGSFTAKQNGSVVQKGTFVLNGKCK